MKLLAVITILLMGSSVGSLNAAVQRNVREVELQYFSFRYIFAYQKIDSSFVRKEYWEPIRINWIIDCLLKCASNDCYCVNDNVVFTAEEFRLHSDTSDSYSYSFYSQEEYGPKAVEALRTMAQGLCNNLGKSRDIEGEFRGIDRTLFLKFLEFLKKKTPMHYEYQELKAWADCKDVILKKCEKEAEKYNKLAKRCYPLGWLIAKCCFGNEPCRW